MWVSASEAISVRSSVLLPVCGAPTIATLPAAPDRSSQYGSRRWSKGLSTIPATACSRPGRSPDVPAAVSPCSGVASTGGRSWSSEAGSFRGGSQIRCAGAPWPASRSTTMSSRLSCLPLWSGTTGGATAAGGSGTRSAPYQTILPRCPVRAGTAGPRASAGWYGPDTYAALNRVIPVVSNIRYALPGSGGSEYASATPSTARLSVAEKVRSPIRYERCVSSPRSRPVSSRCEASSRCTPSERPSRPIITNSSLNSGLAASSSLNSSSTMNSVGSGRRSAPCSRACS